MSIQVPTASEAPPEPPSPQRPRFSWIRWVVMLGVGAGLVSVWDGDTPELPPIDAVEPPSRHFETAATTMESPVLVLPEETFFPGAGTFTAVASSIHGRVAVGHRSDTAGAFIYAADPSGDRWVPGTLAVDERAWIGDAAAWVDGFVIGGAIVGPGMGSSVPTLWYGTAAGDFRVEEHPFAGPGRVDRIRVLRGNLYLIGQGSAPFTDTLAGRAARFGRLVTGRPGSWTDITPDGLNVLVTDIASFGGGLVAVGGDFDGAVVWWKDSAGAPWVQERLGSGTATGVTVTDEGMLTVAVVASDSDGDPMTELFFGDTPRSMATDGSRLPHEIAWIESTGGVVVGGSRSSGSGVWSYRYGHGWAAVEVESNRSGVPTALDADPRTGLVVGSASGQPVMWSQRATTVSTVRSLAGWQFVAMLPGGADQVVDTGTYLFAYRDGLDVDTMWVWSAGGPWRGFEPVDGFGLSGVTETAEGWVMFGETDSAGVVYHAEAGQEPDLVLLPGVSVRSATRTLDRLVVLGTEAGVPYRIEVRPGHEPLRHELDRLPARVIAAGPVLAGADFDGGGVAVSVDNGSTWLSLPGSDRLIGWAGDRVLATSTEPDRILEYYPATGAMAHLQGGVEQTDIVVWGDGVAQVAGEGVVVYDQPEARQVLVDVESGMTGVFQSLIDGPNRLALVTENGVSAIYRWTDAP